jgi:hypothetical protein
VADIEPTTGNEVRPEAKHDPTPETVDAANGIDDD